MKQIVAALLGVAAALLGTSAGAAVHTPHWIIVGNSYDGASVIMADLANLKRRGKKATVWTGEWSVYSLTGQSFMSVAYSSTERAQMEQAAITAQPESMELDEVDCTNDMLAVLQTLQGVNPQVVWQHILPGSAAQVVEQVVCPTGKPQKRP